MKSYAEKESKSPWATTPKGGSFFVPALAVREERERLLVESQRHYGKWQAEVGVYCKRLGVMVTRRT